MNKYEVPQAQEDNFPEQITWATDAINGRTDYKGYQKFLKIEEEIRTGKFLPLGIITLEKAKELKIPAVLVTSSHHHDDAFEAVADLIEFPYRDSLFAGRKDWKGGIEELLLQ